MKEKLKDFIKRYPKLLKFGRRLVEGNLLKSSYKKKIKGFGNELKLDHSAIFINSRFDIIGNNNQVIVEESTVFNNVLFYIRGDNNKIILSHHVNFNNAGSLWIEDENCEIKIGEYSTFQDTNISVTEPNSRIIIGNDCMFAYDVDLRTGDSHSILDSVTNKRINYAQDITIGDHVWVAPHVSILKGVHIRSYSVVGTRSVVTKKFDTENILLGGAPAKVLKENITWDRFRIYDR